MTPTTPLKGGYYATPAAHTITTTARIPPDSTYPTTGFRTFRPSRTPSKA